MRGKFFLGLSVIALAITLVLSLGALNQAKAVPGADGEGYGWIPNWQVNLFGFDGAHNSANQQGRDRDAANYSDNFMDRGTYDQLYGEFPFSYHP